MRNTTLKAAAAAAILLTAGATSANAAITFDALNDTGKVYFDGFDTAAQTPIAGLGADVTYTLTGIGNSGKSWTFSYTLNNDSKSPVTSSRVSMIGFDVAPNVSDVNGLTGIFTSDAENGNVPNVGTVEVCISGNNCAGGAGAGVTQGNSGSGTFVLQFGSTQNAVTLSDFAVRYQSINGVCDNCSSSGLEVPPPTGAVPEPATWAMMMMGIFGAGALMRSRRKAMIAA